MTAFEDGPAKGKHLMLKRCARFLRVVEAADGTFDALDQPDDMPRADEKLYAYEITGEPAMCHINRGGGRGGFYPIAIYRFVKSQPLDPQMRQSAAWREWCELRQRTGIW